jgi:hypothetical protein
MSVLAVAPAVLSAQVNCGHTPCRDGAPQFEAYLAAPAPHAAPPAPLVEDSRMARRFRSVLRAGAATGPNFAGHYTVVTWGCGVACAGLAIVDSATGHAYFPQSLRFNDYHTVRENPLPEPFQFRVDSSLLVIVGAPNEGDKSGIFYYVWKAPKLRLIYSDPRRWPF